MSGQPNKYESDPAKFRAAYMDQLNLRAKLDDENYQVNKVYKATGNMSARSVPDTRSTTEILADTEKLKVSLIATLKPLTGSQMASIVVQGVNGSKLNADGSFFIWFYQNADEIVKQLAKKYKVGIKGDMNDANMMVSHLEDMYSKIKDLSGSVSSYYTNPSTANLKEGDLTELLKIYTRIASKITSKLTGAAITSPELQLTISHIEDISTLISALAPLLSQTFYDDINKLVLMVSTAQTNDQYRDAVQNTDTIYDLSKRYQLLIEKLPNASTLNR